MSNIDDEQHVQQSLQQQSSAVVAQQRPAHPFVEASCISKLLFIWPYHLMSGKNKVRPVDDDTNDTHINDRKNEQRAAIEECDLPQVLPADSSEQNLNNFTSLWNAEQSRAAIAKANYFTSLQSQSQHTNSRTKRKKRMPKNCKPSLHRAIIKDFLSTMWYVQPFMLVSSTAKLVQALALGYLLQSFETPDTSSDTSENTSTITTENKEGYVWATVLVLSGLIVLLEHHHVFFWTWRKGMQYRISCVAAIYDKSLKLNSMVATEQSSVEVGKGKSLLDKKKGTSASSSNGASSGRVVNIATNDVERFLLATLFASYIFWAPIQSIAILGLGWYVIGWSFAAGFGLLVFLFVPLQLWLSKKFAFMRSKIAAITDERVTLVSQAISGVRVMKMSGWEDNFEARIATVRKKECDQIEKVNTYRVLNEAIFFVCNVTTSVIIFIIHVAAGGVLTPRNVFTTMVLINVAQMEITKHLSLAVMGVSECWVSISRIQRFLETPELDERHELPLLKDDNGDAAIIASNVTAYWNGTGRRKRSLSDANDDVEDNKIDTFGLILALDHVDLEFDMGTLTCVIGAVGSGKSALISMLAGELPISTGSLRKRDNSSVSYAPQDPWIMDGTVKENILLGYDYNEEFYTTIINACGLNVDLSQLPSGESTIVGDRGVQLSGGQRARIALARAFYRDADVILLDDPLSAVDSRVGRLLFYSAILELGVNRGKCVILVTHQHQFIAQSRCVMMSEGKVACVGTYQECVDASNGKLTFATQNQSSEDLTKLDGDVLPQKKQSKEKEVESSRVSSDIVKDDKSKEVVTTEANTDDHKETSQVGEVKRDTFLNYARAMPGGIISAILMMILFTATQGAVLACIAAVGKWSDVPAEDQWSGNIIGIVCGLVAVVIVLAVIRAFMSFHLMIQASKKLHDDMTHAVLRSKESPRLYCFVIVFFDTNPLGRILNRFSSDVGSNDDQLPTTFFDFLVIAFLVLGALVSAITVLPVTLVFVPPLIWYFLRVRRVFLTTSRELKRLEGLARSPIFAMLSESLSGISVIRANNAINYFQKKFRTVHDAHGRAFFAYIACSRWLGFRMDGLMFLFLTIASFASVVVYQQAWFAIDPGILGLTISMLIQLSGLFQWCIRQSAEVVNMMVAVERVIGYRDLPSEAALDNDYDKEIENDWPAKGTIDVNDLSVRYRPGLPLSLRGLTFQVSGGSRIGVVGRTGGGKSTLVQSLLRLLEAEGGQITIDGVDISKLGLHKLRTCISVIPQSPVLYGGVSIRENLDPFNHHDDEQISSALLDVHMLEAIRSLSHGLDTTVAEGGLNFSVGQRQLLCLARAILRRNKILVLDEPTANVDSRTDKLLQEAVSKSFRGATILAVAHRLDTVIDFDKILVLGSGGLLEYGSPHELISKEGAFCSMINDTGEEMAALLKDRAKNNSSN